MHLINDFGAASGLWPRSTFALSAAACVGQINDVFTEVVLPMGALLCCIGAFHGKMHCLPTAATGDLTSHVAMAETVALVVWRKAPTVLAVISQPWH